MVGNTRELAMPGGQERMELGSWEKGRAERRRRENLDCKNSGEEVDGYWLRETVGKKGSLR
jgi:hypothetical protein